MVAFLAEEKRESKIGSAILYDESADGHTPRSCIKVQVCTEEIERSKQHTHMLFV